MLFNIPAPAAAQRLPSLQHLQNSACLHCLHLTAPSHLHLAAAALIHTLLLLQYNAADYEDINKELAGISKNELAVLLKKNCHTFTWPCKLQDLDA